MTGEDLGLPPGFIWVVVLGFGAILGSFLNVVIHRLPRIEGYWADVFPRVDLPVLNRHPIEVGDHTVAEVLPVKRDYTLAFPPSRCPKCEREIAWYDNVPVLSWLLLGGKCRGCKARISVRYPLVEGTFAAICAGLYAQYGISLYFAGMIAMAAALVAIFWIDVDFMMIPDSITQPFVWAGLLFHAVFPPQWTGLSADYAIVGAAGGYLFFRAVEGVARVLLRKEGMGRGDAKLAALLGAWLGPYLLAVGLFLGFLIGSVMGVVVELVRRGFDLRAALRAMVRHETRPFPFGPSLVLGGFASVFAGGSILQWYFGLMRG